MYSSHPRQSVYSCMTCRITFQTQDRQRNHCRTDWHKYNLKRKIANLAPVTAEQFAQKVLAQQAKGKEEEERQGIIYTCSTCRKSYITENAFQNHMQSKRHKEQEIKRSILAPHKQQQSKRKINPMFSDLSDQSDLEDNQSLPPSGLDDPLAECLFCLYPNSDFESNLIHMQKAHGFFLPDHEYLQDCRGLITYLAQKIRHDFLCLYCNGRGREWKSANAARAHMLDKGHCKMAYDESENPEDLLQFYNFEPLMDLAPRIETENELILDNGVRLGHRRHFRFFKQRLRSKTNEQEDTAKAKALEEAEALAREQGLNRRERRHLLAITDGRKGGSSRTDSKTIEGIREAVFKQQQQRQQVTMMHNRAITLRSRDQVPK